MAKEITKQEMIDILRPEKKVDLDTRRSRWFMQNLINNQWDDPRTKVRGFVPIFASSWDDDPEVYSGRFFMSFKLMDIFDRDVRFDVTNPDRILLPYRIIRKGIEFFIGNNDTPFDVCIKTLAEKRFDIIFKPKNITEDRYGLVITCNTPNSSLAVHQAFAGMTNYIGGILTEHYESRRKYLTGNTALDLVDKHNKMTLLTAENNMAVDRFNECCKTIENTLRIILE